MNTTSIIQWFILIFLGAISFSLSASCSDDLAKIQNQKGKYWFMISVNNIEINTLEREIKNLRNENGNCFIDIYSRPRSGVDFGSPSRKLSTIKWAEGNWGKTFSWQ